jgi:hypothetical protein
LIWVNLAAQSGLHAVQLTDILCSLTLTHFECVCCAHPTFSDSPQPSKKTMNTDFTAASVQPRSRRSVAELGFWLAALAIGGTFVFGCELIAVVDRSALTCADTEEIVGGQCVDKCGAGETRGADGLCSVDSANTAKSETSSPFNPTVLTDVVPVITVITAAGIAAATGENNDTTTSSSTSTTP